jgi:hypothetical protein
LWVAAAEEMCNATDWGIPKTNEKLRKLGDMMSRKPTVVLPLATALASLMGAATTTTTDTAKAVPHDVGATVALNGVPSTELKADSFFRAGDELLSFVMSEREDGTIVAQHVSHASHASHASHRSHYSSS